MKLLDRNIEKLIWISFSLMKRIIFVILILCAYSISKAQSRKHSSNFSLFQHYYNPAFTGFKGSAMTAYYREQWAGFDGAPKTLFLSGEVNIADFRRHKEPMPEGDQPITPKSGIQHAVGLSILHDTFGPFVENQLFASYSSFINLSEKMRLKAGAAVAYHGQILDGRKLTAEESHDPSLQNYINKTTRAGKMDFNIGVALSGEDFYAGYAMQNVRGGLGKSKNDFFKNNSKIHYTLQGGYRRAVSDRAGVVINALIRFDDQLKETLEGQIKGVFYNTAWLGVGYRSSLAYALNVGFRINQLKVGYAYEIPTGEAQMTGSGTNELMVTYDFQKIIHPRLTRQMSIW